MKITDLKILREKHTFTNLLDVKWLEKNIGTKRYGGFLYKEISN